MSDTVIEKPVYDPETKVVRFNDMGASFLDKALSNDEDRVFASRSQQQANREERKRLVLRGIVTFKRHLEGDSVLACEELEREHPDLFLDYTQRALRDRDHLIDLVFALLNESIALDIVPCVE